jgi:hypothetical protein
MQFAVRLMFVCSLLLAVVPARQPKDVAVPNGNMEYVLTGTITPDLWTPYLGETTKAVVEVDRKVAHAGSQSVRISNQTPPGPGSFAMLCSPTFPVNPNTTYRFSCFVRGHRSGKAVMRINGLQAPLSQPLPEGDFAWQQVTCTGTSPAAGAELQIQFVVEGTAEALWVDDVSIEKDKHQPATLTGANKPRPRPQSEVAAELAWNVLDYGASPSADDNTSAVQRAINACGTAGGGIVQIPAGQFRFTGRLLIQHSRVWLRGVGSATNLQFDNGANDCIVVGGNIPALPPVNAGATYDCRLTQFKVTCGSKTAGRAIAIVNHGNFIMEQVSINHAIVGVYLDTVNNAILRDMVIIPDNAAALNKPDVPWSSWVGVWWDTTPKSNDPSSRSDVVQLNSVVINMLAASLGTCILWDGTSYGEFVINDAMVMHGKYGLRVANTRGNTKALVPQFLSAFALDIEGCEVGMSIETGAEFKFTGGNVDMTKGHAIQILNDPHNPAMPCGVQITNSRIGGSEQCAILADSKNIIISDCQLFSNSLAGKNKYPAISVGPHAEDVLIHDIHAEESIGARNTSYAVSVEKGASNIQINNLNAHYINLGAVEDKGAKNLQLGLLIEPDGVAPRNAARVTTSTNSAR